MRSFCSLESGIDDLVGLQGGDHDISDPQAAEDAGSDGLDGLGTSEFASDGRISPD